MNNVDRHPVGKLKLTIRDRVKISFQIFSEFKQIN